MTKIGSFDVFLKGPILDNFLWNQ